MMTIQQLKTSSSPLMKICQFWKEMMTHLEWKKLIKVCQLLCCLFFSSFFVSYVTSLSRVSFLTKLPIVTSTCVHYGSQGKILAFVQATVWLNLHCISCLYETTDNHQEQFKATGKLSLSPFCNSYIFFSMSSIKIYNKNILYEEINPAVVLTGLNARNLYICIYLHVFVVLKTCKATIADFHSSTYPLLHSDVLEVSVSTAGFIQSRTPSSPMFSESSS